MWICSNCNQKNREHRRFCMDCGTGLEGSLCAGCGFLNQLDDRYCGGCGHDLTRSGPEGPGTDPDPSSKKTSAIASPKDLETVMNEVRAEITEKGGA